MPQKLTGQAVCETYCDEQPGCVAYTFRYQNNENKCWLMSEAGPRTGANGAYYTHAGFISAFCTRGGRGTCCFDGATSCEACNRELSPRSYCHHDNTACQACASRLEQELTDDLATGHATTNTNDDHHDPDGHLCVVCMDNERSCLYVPCNHLVVCVECDADIMAACLPCPYCNEAIDREESVVGLVVA